jgi:hypothetical protein
MRVERVRITKAYLDSYWYADKIGQEFCVFGFCYWQDRQRYEIIQTGTYAMKPTPHYIDEGDFEVLDVFDADILEQVTIEIRPTNRNIQDFDNE